MSKVSIHTTMMDYGQMVDGVTLTGKFKKGITAADFEIKDCYNDLSAKFLCKGVTGVEETKDGLVLTIDPFLYRIDTFEITGTGKAEGIKIYKGMDAEVVVHHADWFEAKNEKGVNYRLYSPADAESPRPLVLFLHGGGGSGTDNLTQLTDTLGPIKLAERNPDMYVMAPQAPAGTISMQEAFLRATGFGKYDPYEVHLGVDADNAFDSRGWVRWYLAKIADIIRGMIKEGKVDGSRVYVIGMSMGGGGTLKMISVAPDLFAAAAPICPSMNAETFPILDNLPPVPTYVSASYIDHQPSRHAYISRAVMNNLKKGRKDVELVIYTTEELGQYGIGTTKGLTQAELFAENHNCWILTLHNEYGILDWMYSHVKK